MTTIPIIKSEQSNSIKSLNTTRGVKNCNKALLQKTTPLDKESYPVTNQCLQNMSDFFNASSHFPNLNMWEALQDISRTMEGMANGDLEENVFVSSLDPGVGKTQSISHFVRVLLRSDLKNVGVIICVSRKSEIRDIIETLNLTSSEVGVLTSDKEVNQLGGPNPETRPVLITTQQMISKRCNSGRFESVSCFQYREIPRAVRVWDEAILPGETLTLNRDSIAFLFSPLRYVRPDLADRLEELFNDLKDWEDKSTHIIPDFAVEFNMKLYEVVRLLDNATENQKQTAECLWYLSGKSVTVRKDGTLGNTMLDYRDTLPLDLAPVLVLDASARVRKTYSLWESNRGNLVRLKSATKDYNNLNIQLWKKGGGKNSFKKDTDHYVEGIVNTINSRPDEEWLVIHHKETSQMKLTKYVLKNVKGDPERIHFISWGNHHGTNDYKNVSNVILAGTLFYRPSYYESLTRLSAGHPSSNGKVAECQVSNIVTGEHMHQILQALCRGSVRRCVDGKAVACNAYIIASKQSGIGGALSTVFPGSTIQSWNPVPFKSRGKTLAAMEFLKETLPLYRGSLLPFKTVMDAISINDSKNFRKRIRRDLNFTNFLKENRIVEHGKGFYPTGFADEYEAKHRMITF